MMFKLDSANHDAIELWDGLMMQKTNETENAMDMSHSVGYKFLCAALLLGLGFLSSSFPIFVSRFPYFQRKFSPNHIFNIVDQMGGFSGGILLALAFLHLCPDGGKLMSKGFAELLPDGEGAAAFPWNFFLLGVCFYITFAAESIVLHVSSILYKDNPSESQPSVGQIMGDGNSDNNSELKRRSNHMNDSSNEINIEVETVQVTEPTNTETKEKTNEQQEEPLLVNHPHLFEEKYVGKRASLVLSFIVIWISLFVWLFFSGLDIGIQDHEFDLWNLFGSNILHKIVATFAFGFLVNNGCRKVWFAMIWLVSLVCSTPLGVVIGIIVHETSDSALHIHDSAPWAMTQGVIVSLVSGTCAYVSLLEIAAKQSTHTKSPYLRALRFLFFLIGFGIIAALARWSI